MPSNVLLPEFSLGSVIPFRCNESWEMRKIRNYNTWIGSCYREKSLYNVFESLTSRAKNYGIPNVIIEDAKYKYKIISEVKISRGENRIGIIASCLFIACYENNSRRSIKEISEIFKISPTSMTKGFKKFNETMLTLDPELKKKFDYSISESIDFINRFCSNLNLDEDIIEICKNVCKEIEYYDLVSENTPTSKAAGSIYLVSYLFNLNISKKNISSICSTSEVTISKCFIKLIDYYIYLIPENMLKYLAIDFIHKFSNSLIKYFNKEVQETFLKKSLKLFQKCIQINFINNNKHVTFLAASIVYYLVLENNFTNININEIYSLFHIKEKSILLLYDKLKKCIEEKKIILE
jgi:transcription initiation factor TFIIIB Brf1 subunit/transcription initiation factor TFIIB